MIKIFEDTDAKKIEDEVDEWIVNSGSKIHDVQFRANVTIDGRIRYTVCVITELNLHIF